MADDRYQVTAIVGPFCGYVLTMTRAEAEQAVAEGWAVMQSEPPYDLAVAPADYPELPEAKRGRALALARAWAETFNRRPE